MESGVDAAVEKRFPGASVTYGSAASGAGGNREIPPSEGGEIGREGQTTKARHFEGPGSPRQKMEEEKYHQKVDEEKRHQKETGV